MLPEFQRQLNEIKQLDDLHEVQNRIASLDEEVHSMLGDERKQLDDFKNDFNQQINEIKLDDLHEVQNRVTSLGEEVHSYFDKERKQLDDLRNMLPDFQQQLDAIKLDDLHAMQQDVSYLSEEVHELSDLISLLASVNGVDIENLDQELENYEDSDFENLFLGLDLDDLELEENDSGYDDDEDTDDNQDDYDSEL
jgi:hypothetical protein